MNNRVLKYFLTVVQVGSISKAAEVLHITQPTLSRQLMELEEELGTTLLTRGHREVALTDSGVIFQQRAAEILALMEKTEKDLSHNKELVSGNIAIGCVESTVSKKLAEVIFEFHKKYPLVTFDLYGANGDDIKEKLDWGALDIGIVLEPVETAKYDFHRLNCEERWGVILNKEEPLAQKTEVVAEDLVGQPLMLPRREIVIEEIAKWLGVQRSGLNLVMTHNLFTNMLPIMEQNMGIIIGIEGALTIRPSEKLCFIPFSPKRVSNHVVIWKKNKVFSKATTLFMEYIKENMG